jgi:anti-sigma factor RsiW
MSSCRRIAERLTPFVDDALPSEERAEIEQHLDRCPPCRAAAVREQGGRAVVRECAGRLKAGLPPGLRTRCEALASEQVRRPEPRGWGVRLVPLSLTSVLIVFTAVALFSLATHRSNTLLAAQLTADHSKCFSLFAPAGPAPASAEAVERMLADRHGWDVHVPPSAPDRGVQLIGARRCLYADGRMPHVMYRVNGQDVSLYMLQGVRRDEADLVTLGHRSRIWSRGATTYVLVTPASAGDMTDATRYVMQEAH